MGRTDEGEVTLQSFVCAVLLFGCLIVSAEAKCPRDQFKLGSSGQCVSKASELGRRYYTGRHRARYHRSRRPTGKPTTVPAVDRPPVIPATGVDPAPASDGFTDRFFYPVPGKTDRLPPVNLTPQD